MIAFLADEDFPYPAVVALRALSHDVLTISDVGMAGVGTPDLQVIAVALQAERVILTLNRRHFAANHRAEPDHAGIVTCTLGLDFSALAARIAEAVRDQVTLRGRLIAVVRPNPPA